MIGWLESFGLTVRLGRLVTSMVVGKYYSIDLVVQFLIKL